MTLPEKYSRPAIVLHWAIAALIIANVLLVWSVDYLPKGAERSLIDTHKSIGITVLGLALMRLIWRLTHQPPALPKVYSGWERVSAHGAHFLLYAVIFALPITGWIHDSAWKAGPEHPMKLFGVIPWFRIPPVASLEPTTKEQWHTLFGHVHTLMGYGLYALLAAHVLGALKHQFWDRERELQRMWL